MRPNFECALDPVVWPVSVPSAPFRIERSAVERFSTPPVEYSATSKNEGFLRGQATEAVTRCSWFQKKSWQEEIKRMLSSGLEYELDALANKDFQYLTKQYLPRKLKEKDWLD